MKFCQTLAAAALLSGTTAWGQTFEFTNSVSRVIPDGNPTGISSTIDVSGLDGRTLNLDVSLNISGGYSGDLYARLTGPTGAYSILLNRVGVTSENSFGYEDAGLTIKLSDSAPTDIHVYGGNGGFALSGIWQPDGRAVDPQLVLDTDLRLALLSSFDDSNPNGTWTLFVTDLAGGGQSTLVGWGMTITVVPEPGVMTLCGFGVVGGFWMWRRNQGRGN